MKSLHSIHAPHHWIAVAVALAGSLFVLSEAHGQHTGAAAVFEGRPAMAGAQGGQGALAGPPQGGIGVQGTEDAGISLTRRPATVTTPRGELQAASNTNSSDSLLNPNRGDINVAPRKDDGVAKDDRGAVKKTRRAAKKVVRRDRVPVIERAASQ